ncbi:MAG: M23 family metallopeptidase [Candidatus Micrarchaeota archaeon]
MKKSVRVLAIIAVVSVLVLALVCAGCLQKPSAPITTVKLDIKGEEVVASDCACMECTYTLKEKIAGLFSFKPISIAGAECAFTVCDMESVAKVLEGGKEPGLRYFFVGQGGTFYEFFEAQKYCGNHLEVAVKWVARTDGTEPYLPARTQASCMLEQDVIPMYLYYTEGKAISAERIGELAKRLKGVGPTFVAPEVNFGKNDVPMVREQVFAVKRECANCMVVVVPKDGEALEELLKDSATLAKVDVIGTGVLFNEDKYACEPLLVVPAIIDDSKKMLESYGKPTFVVFYGGAETTSFAGNCKWTNEKVAQAYNEMFANTGPLTLSGVIGMAHVSWVDKQLPIEIQKDETQWGLTTAEEAQKQPQFNVLFGNCVDYYENKNKVPIIFPSQGGSAKKCVGASSMGMLEKTKDEGVFDLSKYDQVVEPKQLQFKCDSCLGGKYNVPASYEKDVLYDSCSVQEDRIQTASEKCDLDPLMVRAIAIQESGLDECKISYAPISSDNCNALNLMSITDPRGICPSSRTSEVEMRFDSTAGKCVEQKQASDSTAWSTWEQCKPCGYGLMQSKWMPGSQYGVYKSFNPFDATQSLDEATDELCSLQDKMEDFAISKGIVASNWREKESKEDAHAIAQLTVLAYYLGENDAGAEAYNAWLKQKECTKPAGDYLHDWVYCTDRDKNGDFETCCDGTEAGRTFAPNANPPACALVSACCNQNKDCCGNGNFADYVGKCTAANENPAVLSVLATYNSLLDKCPNDCEEGVGLNPDLPGTCPYESILSVVVDCKASGLVLDGGVCDADRGSVSRKECGGAFCAARPNTCPEYLGKNVISHYSDGVDIYPGGAGTGLLVKAVEAGTIVSNKFTAGAGNEVVVKGTECTYYYRNLAKSADDAKDGALAGMLVSKGDVIGTIGTSGYVHLTVKKTVNSEEKYVNPTGVCTSFKSS